MTKEMVFLTKKEMQAQAPSIFQDSVSPEVSKHYTHIPTGQVIDDMAKLGWKVSAVREIKARKTNTKGYQKHLICFQNPGLVIEKDNETLFPQVYLINSRDGKNAFRLFAGIYRTISNMWIVAPREQFNFVRIRHMGYSFEELEIQINNMIKRLPTVIDLMNLMVNTQMREDEIYGFAEKALKLRLSNEEISNIDIESFCFPNRTIDKGNQLWNVFNTIQDKIIYGGYVNGLTKNGKQRKARQIKNFTQNLKISESLFNIAITYIK